MSEHSAHDPRPRWRRADIVRGAEVTLTVDGEPITAYAGETVAAAMLAAGAAFDTDRAGEGRSPLCNMGTCFECVAEVDARALTRTCLTQVRDGMVIRTQERP